MQQEFNLNQYPGQRLEFSVSFNTKEPNTVMLYREDILIAFIDNVPGPNLPEDVEYVFSDDGYLDISKNLAKTAKYRITCETEVGPSYCEEQINDPSGYIRIGFDDRRGQVIDYNDAIVAITISE